MLFGLFRKIFWVAIVVVVAFGIWILPKYRYLKEHPDRCAQIAGNFYYCGRSAQLDRLFSLPDEVQNRIREEIRIRFEQQN
jgi:hypothetical protein